MHSSELIDEYLGLVYESSGMEFDELIAKNEMRLMAKKEMQLMAKVQSKALEIKERIRALNSQKGDNYGNKK